MHPVNKRKTETEVHLSKARLTGKPCKQSVIKKQKI